jgi:ABC-2 type transport system permease protein
VLLLSAGFGASMTAVTVSNDMTGGIIDRFRSMDVAGASVLAGHVAASMVRNALSTLLVFGVAFLIGFRPSAGPLESTLCRPGSTASPRTSPSPP